ncbi:MAG: thioredoxin family protein [Patescibacteria group bacterium]
MNRNLLIAIGILILITLGGGFFYLNQRNNSSYDEMMKKDDSMMMKEGSRYVEYSKEILDNSSDKRRVLYFYANWCPICRPTDANLKENINKIPQDSVVIRVNYNDTDTDQEEKDLAKKYAVTYQHTFVQVDKNENEITRWNGGQIDELLTNLK